MPQFPLRAGWAGASPRHNSSRAWALKGQSQPLENVLCKRLKSASLWLTALLLLCLLGLPEQGSEATVMMCWPLGTEEHRA